VGFTVSMKKLATLPNSSGGGDDEHTHAIRVSIEPVQFIDDELFDELDEHGFRGVFKPRRPELKEQIDKVLNQLFIR
jgi:hypothetical protein